MFIRSLLLYIKYLNSLKISNITRFYNLLIDVQSSVVISLLNRCHSTQYQKPYWKYRNISKFGIQFFPKEGNQSVIVIDSLFDQPRWQFAHKSMCHNIYHFGTNSSQCRKMTYFNVVSLLEQNTTTIHTNCTFVLIWPVDAIWNAFLLFNVNSCVLYLVFLCLIKRKAVMTINFHCYRTINKIIYLMKNIAILHYFITNKKYFLYMCKLFYLEVLCPRLYYGCLFSLCHKSNVLVQFTCLC